MKKILCIISKDVIRRNIYETNFWPELLKQNPDLEFHLLVEGDYKESFEKDFAGERVIVHEYDRHSYYGYNRWVFFLVRTGINSNSTKLYRKRAYIRKEASFKQHFAKELLANTFANFNWYKKLVRYLVSKMKIDNDLRRILDEIEPDMVFTPSLIDNDYDVPVCIEARNRGIKIVGMVRSWDNLNNHGILALVPDRFIVQNTWLIEMAVKYQSVKPGFITDVVGLPHYDLYKDPKKFIKPKEEFFRELGLDPNKNLILLGGSDFYYTEDKLPRIIDNFIEDGTIKQPTQVFFRPHPRSLFSRTEYDLDSLKHTILDGGKRGQTGFSDTDKLINLFYYADIIISIASTLSIDAAVFKTPAITIAFDSPKAEGQKKLSYWEEVGRLHDTFDHYEKLVSTGGARTPKSKEELAKDINEYLENPSLDADGRQKILDNFVEPFDGKSGERLAGIVSEELRKSG